MRILTDLEVLEMLQLISSVLENDYPLDFQLALDAAAEAMKEKFLWKRRFEALTSDSLYEFRRQVLEHCGPFHCSICSHALPDFDCDSVCDGVSSWEWRGLPEEKAADHGTDGNCCKREFDGFPEETDLSNNI